MNSLKKEKVKATLKYTWPIYIIAGVLIALLLNFIFGVTHRPPAYQTLTVFVSGEVNDSKKLENDMLEKFSDHEIKTFSCIASHPEEASYNTRLTVAGYNGADVLIIPLSKLEKLVVDAFALEMTTALVNEYYQGYTLFSQENVNSGVKVDKEKVKGYMSLPSEDCYLLLNGKSVNNGEYGYEPVKEHDMALKLVQDWGM